MDKKTLRHIAKVLRRGTLTWDGRNRALAKASKKKWEGKRNKKGEKILKTYWKCATCLEWFRDKSQVEVDHVVEVGELDSYQGDIGLYAKRMYNEENLQILCVVCHLKKTKGWSAKKVFKRKPARE